MTKPQYRVRIEPSGHEYNTDEGETILAGALRHGYMLPYSCRTGSCGTCKGTLVSGAIDYGTYEEKALSPAERAAGKALFCQAVPRADIVIHQREIAAAEDIAIKTLPCRVVAMERVAHDVMVLSLKPPQTERLAFLAGQYIDILLRDGNRRSFSLANPPQQNDVLQIHVRHVPGGAFTAHVFTRMKEKDIVRFRGPLGVFFLRPDSDLPLILVAGGTGFAPIKSMLEDAASKGVTRPMHLYWGVRARRDLYMHTLVQGWAQARPGFRYTPVLSEPAADDAWTGRTGWVHAAVLADYPDLRGHEVYASGPPPMVAAIRATFPRHGLPEERLYYDSFEFAHAV